MEKEYLLPKPVNKEITTGSETFPDELTRFPVNNLDMFKKITNIVSVLRS